MTKKRRNALLGALLALEHVFFAFALADKTWAMVGFLVLGVGLLVAAGIGIQMGEEWDRF